jgi:hypothetical protein
VEAVVDVLLDDDWDAVLMTDDELRAHLRTRTWERHQVARPITEHRVGGKRIMSLSTPVGLEGSGELCLADVIPSTSQVEDLVLHMFGASTDPRLRYVLSQLPAEARQLLVIRADDPSLTWDDAGSLAGLDPIRAESIRRRVRRLAAEVDRRRRSRNAGDDQDGYRR